MVFFLLVGVGQNYDRDKGRELMVARRPLPNSDGTSEEGRARTTF